MLEQTTRALTDSERRAARATLGARFTQRRLVLRRSFLASFAICGTFCVLTLLASNAPAWIVLGVWGVLAVGIATWASIDVRRTLSATIRALEDALARDTADVVHIRASALVELEEIEEIEDEGACYAFQVEDRRIVFVSGQDYYASAKFPNTDFSLVHLHDSCGELVEMWIAKHGVKAAPVRTISAATKRKLDVPDHLATLDGHLADLETLLAASE